MSVQESIAEPAASPRSRPEISAPSDPAGVRADVCRALAACLEAGGDVERFAAVKALARLGADKSTAALCAALRDNDEDVRMEAAASLGAHGEAGAAADLLASLTDDPCGDVKCAAAEALGRLRHRDAVPVLRRLAVTRDGVAWDEEEFYAGGWDDWLDVQIKAIEALGQIGAADAVPDIVAAMQDEMGQDLLPVGCRVLACLGDDGAAALAGFLQSGNDRERAQAAAALAAQRSAAARSVLAAVLDDPSAAVRLAALRGLAAKDPRDDRLDRFWRDPAPALRSEMFRLCPSTAQDRLAALIRDKDPGVQKAVLQAVAADRAPLAAEDRMTSLLKGLLRRGTPEVAAEAGSIIAACAPPAVAVSALQAVLLEDGPPAVLRSAAARLLGGLGGEAAVQALQAAVAEPEHAVRRAALSALADLAREHGDRTDRRAARAWLIDLLTANPPETPASPEPEAEQSAADAADPDLGDAASTSTLAAILDAERQTRREPADAAPEALDESDRAFLDLAEAGSRKRRVVGDKDIAPREDTLRLVAALLGEISGDDVLAALTQALSSEDGALKMAAADSLARHAQDVGRLPPDTVRALGAGLDAVSDPDESVALIRALGLAEPGGSAVPLAARLSDAEARVRAEAGLALLRRGRGADAVGPLLDDPDPEVRLTVLAGLLETGAPDAEITLPALMACIRDFPRSHHRQAARLMRRLDPALAAAALLDWLHDPNRQRLRPTVIESIEALYAPAAANT